MINDKYKVIFIHYAKTGGSSIEHYFEPHKSVDGYRETIVSLSSGKKKIVKENHHMSSSQFINNNGNEVWNDFFKFSFVRNPWDWFVSHFHWDIAKYKENAALGLPQKYRRKFIVEDCNSDFKTYVSEGAKRPKWFVFPSMKEYCEGVNFVGKFENLQNDFNLVCKEIGAPIQKLGHLKKPAPRNHYTQFYDEHCKEIVYNIMRKDIEHFNYNFEGHNERHH